MDNLDSTFEQKELAGRPEHRALSNDPEGMPARTVRMMRIEDKWTKWQRSNEISAFLKVCVQPTVYGTIASHDACPEARLVENANQADIAVRSSRSFPSECRQ